MIHRGKSKTCNEIIRGYLFEDENNSYIVISEVTPVPKHGSRSSTIRYYPVEKDSVGAFTGMEDRNGKMTFEKDWLELEDGSFVQIVFVDGAYGVFIGKKFVPLRDLREPEQTVSMENGEEEILSYRILFRMVPEREMRAIREKQLKI